MRARKSRRRPSAVFMGGHFKGNGQPKREFRTYDEAREFLEVHPEPVRIYRCPLCTMYHLATRR